MTNTTLYLTAAWDLTTDSAGNIAVASAPYAMAQDAATAIQTNLGECRYDTSKGLPYMSQILGKNPPIELIRSQMVAAAMTVPDVTSAKVYFTNFANRVLTGQVQVTDSNGIVSAATISPVL